MDAREQIELTVQEIASAVLRLEMTASKDGPAALEGIGVDLVSLRARLGWLIEAIYARKAA